MVNFTMMVRNRISLTRQSLSSLAESGLDGMTVTIQDDRSDWETREWVMNWCADHGAHYLRNETPMGTGPLRNQVIRESVKHFGKGKYLAPHDNDTFFKPNWLHKLTQCYELARPYGFRLLAAYGHPFHQPIAHYSMPPLESNDILTILEVQAVATQSQFMEWSTYDDIGEFCDTPIDKTCQSEDVDWTNKLRAKGFKLGVVYPHLIHATALKNTFGDPGPGWEYVKAECPEGVLCE